MRAMPVRVRRIYLCNSLLLLLLFIKNNILYSRGYGRNIAETWQKVFAFSAIRIISCAYALLSFMIFRRFRHSDRFRTFNTSHNGEFMTKDAQSETIQTELESYPKLGSTISFVRVTRGDDKEVLSGEKVAGVLERGKGIVIAIHADAFGRKLVRVKTAEKEQKNIFLAAVNPSDEVAETLLAAEKEVARLEEEGNGIVQQTVEDYNKRVEETYVSVLGAPVVF